MLRLIRVEISRLLARRAVRVLAIALLAGIVFGNGYRFTKHSRDLEAARAHARAEATEQRERLRRDYDEMVADFERARAENPGLSDEFGPPPLDEMLAQVDERHFYSDPRYRMTDAGGEAKAVGIVVALLAFAIGTTFGGAEWSAGTMQALLFWEPRRGRVVAAKLAALGIVLVGASYAAQLLQLGFAAVTAALRGTFDGVPPGFYGGVLTTGVRIALLALFASWLAFGIAGLTRNSAAALGVAFAYFAVVENVVRAFRPGWQRWLIGNQFEAWVEKRVQLFEPGAEFEPVFHQPFVLHMNRAGLTLLAYLTVVVAAMAVTFVRRDVT